MTVRGAVYREDYQQPEYRIETVELDFDLHETATQVRAKIRFTANENLNSDRLQLDGEDLKLISISIDGRQLTDGEYKLDDEHLTLSNLPQQFELQSVVEINPTANSKLSGLYRTSANFCTQCEALGFRRITYFLDRPDVMATYRVTLTADKAKYPVLLSNGNRIEERDVTGGRHTVVWEDPFPKPSYLFALVAGNLKCHAGTFNTCSGREIQLEIWVEPQNVDRCEHALKSLQKSMKWDEDVFGLEYDLDIYMIVAVNDFNMGAMENKGLNVFNSKYVLARPDTATDADFEGIESVVAHEYFHNWTGNRVTCRDWFQLTLKEGLTVFRDQEFTSDMTSRSVKRIDDVKSLRGRQFSEDGGPMAHPIRPESYVSMDNFYTATVYDKGGEVIRMYQTLLGKDGFRKGMDLYFARHDGQAVTCDDFRAAMADANGRDLELFGRWYSQAGTPQLTVEDDWDEQDQVYMLILSQSYPDHPYDVPGTTDRQPVHVPVAVGFLDSGGNEIATTCKQHGPEAKLTHVLELQSTEQTFAFTGFQSKPIPSLLRNFTAPVRLKMNRSREDLAFLMSHDTDSFSRWDACQALATRVLLELLGDHRLGQSLNVANEFTNAFGNVLEDETLDGSFKSLLMNLPSEQVLAQELEVVDPEAIHHVRSHAVRQLATMFRSQLLGIYECNKNAEYRNDFQSVQRRRLKNMALAYLATLEDSESIQLVTQQFEQVDNMTDEQSALSILCELDVPERDVALQIFYEKWRDDPLVMDKWFAAQASSSLPSTNSRVVELAKHTDFTLENPNRVRALIGAFGVNQVRFHQADGTGYDFLANWVIELDRINPQVGARMVAPFNQWKRFDAARQLLMSNQLRRIMAVAKSKDVIEIVDRALS